MKNVGYKRARHQFGLKYVQMCILGKCSTTCKEWLYNGDGIRGFLPPPPFSSSDFIHFTKIGMLSCVCHFYMLQIFFN